MKRFLLIVFFLTISINLSRVMWGEMSGNSVFEEAILKETAEHDIEGAIDLYRRIIASPNNDLTIRAKAEFRLALCLERIGSEYEAKQLYQDIISQTTQAFGDIAQLAQVNFQRLQVKEEEMLRQEKLKNEMRKIVSPIRRSFEVGLYGTHVFHADPTQGLTKNQNALIVEGLFQTNSSWWLGVEVASFLPKNSSEEINDSLDAKGNTFITKTYIYEDKSNYLGLTLKADLLKRKISPYFQFGLGVSFRQTSKKIIARGDSGSQNSPDDGVIRMDPKILYEENTIENHSDFTLPICVGVRINLIDKIALAAGVKDFLIYQKPTYQVAEERYTLRQIIVGYIGIVSRF